MHSPVAKHMVNVAKRTVSYEKKTSSEGLRLSVEPSNN